MVYDLLNLILKAFGFDLPSADGFANLLAKRGDLGVLMILGMTASPLVAEWEEAETWSGVAGAPAEWQVVESWTGTVRDPVVPGKPVLVSPADGTITNDNTPTFTWIAGTYATSHRLAIDDDPNFADGDNIYDNANLGGSATSCTIENELLDDNYSWKVIAINAQGENESDVWTFVINTQQYLWVQTTQSDFEQGTLENLSAAGDEEDGESKFRTKGDSLPELDKYWVFESHIKGVELI